MARRRPARGGAGGVTLVELMVTLAIVAVLLAITLPSMREFIARKRLEGIAQELVTDLRLLKSHQIQNRPNTGTAIGFGTTDSKSCYILFVKGDNVENCDCTAAEDLLCGPADAEGLRPSPIRQVTIPRDSGVRITSNRTSLDMLGYNAMPRLNRTLSIAVTGTDVGEIRITTNATGVPAVCAVSGVFASIKACPS
ncbi:pilus assembly FimT family protein [Pseudaquabacterium pictum]|nr:prepilin-type N-terminal cleavage/methylation domain-containing protein [Rubrivivax pictus]